MGSFLLLPCLWAGPTQRSGSWGALEGLRVSSALATWAVNRWTEGLCLLCVSDFPIQKNFKNWKAGLVLAIGACHGMTSHRLPRSGRGQDERLCTCMGCRTRENRRAGRCFANHDSTSKYAVGAGLTVPTLCPPAAPGCLHPVEAAETLRGDSVVFLACGSGLGSSPVAGGSVTLALSGLS